MKSIRLAVAMLVSAGALALGATAASAAVVYKNTPSPAPGNLPSQAFEATSTSEFGGQVALARTKHQVTSVSVDMSSWACQKGANETCETIHKAKFVQPLTLRLYEVGAENKVGALLYEGTQTFQIRYRPSENPTCPLTGEHNKGWGSECFSGFLQKVTFNVPRVTVPQHVIVAIAFNTENYGEYPTGVPGPYNSLNVAVDSEYNEVTKEWMEFQPVSIGSDPAPADAYIDSTWGGAYCNEAEGTGTFRLDPGCWKDLQPAFAIKAI
ncbi:MAG TPA: hypothetical protein VK272_00485 [Solirubrobacteraceae bacterium]|nr:hypothetical protein [Solirubrobacteraceae bacterium]